MNDITKLVSFNKNCEARISNRSNIYVYLFLVLEKKKQKKNCILF